MTPKSSREIKIFYFPSASSNFISEFFGYQCRPFLYRKHDLFLYSTTNDFFLGQEMIELLSQQN